MEYAKHLLDVPLLEADRRREDRGERADDDDDDLRDRRQREQHVAARDQVHAGRHHRRRVDQRRDRRRARHRVGEPDVERDLRALAGASEEQEETDAPSPRRRRHGSDVAAALTPLKSSVPMFANIMNIATRNPKSPMRFTMNAFLPASAFAFSLNQKPMSKYEHKPDAFPPDEQNRIVAAEHQQQHEEDEQVEIREVARISRIVLHVSDAEQMDEHADARDDERHHHRQLVELERGVDAARSPTGIQEK